MPVYRVIRKSDKRTVYAYSGDSAYEFSEYPFSDFDHIEEVSVNPNGTIDELPGTLITPLAFRKRFTSSEKVTIEIASLDDPSATMEQRGSAASLRAYMQDIQAAKFINISLPETRAAIQNLEQFGLIGVGRAAEILDTAPTPEEAYTGQ